jgi:hypothetical protein
MCLIGMILSQKWIMDVVSPLYLTISHRGLTFDKDRPLLDDSHDINFDRCVPQ